MLPLVYLGNPILHKKTQPLKPAEIPTAKVQTFAKELLDTIPHLPAAGLAAPQLGKSYRMFAITLDKDDLEFTSPEKGLIQPNQPHLFINPEITAQSREIITEEEGCLSIPYYAGYIPRFAEITLTYLDLKGKKHTINAKNFMARVLQHELDHLNGILWLDRLRSPKEMYYIQPQEWKGM